MMELPVLDKFCFVISLRTGCLSMGLINAVLSLILAILLITQATGMKDGDLKKDEEVMSGVVYTIVVLLVVLLLVRLVLDLGLVYAVYKEKTSIIKKYCIFWVVFLVLFIIGFLKTLFHMEAGYVVAQLMFLAENFYYIVTIRSYLISINEDGVI